jgi:DNA-binding transcriptional MerR regulator
MIESLPVYNVETLAKKADVTIRTIHFYVQRGLLPRPEGGGRGHYYTEVHLERLKQIQQWRAQGVPLEKMKEHFSGETSWSVAAPATRSFAEDTKVSHWTRISVGADIEIGFKRGVLNQEDQEAIKKYVLSRVNKK